MCEATWCHKLRFGSIWLTSAIPILVQRLKHRTGKSATLQSLKVCLWNVDGPQYFSHEGIDLHHVLLPLSHTAWERDPLKYGASIILTAWVLKSTWPDHSFWNEVLLTTLSPVAFVLQLGLADICYDMHIGYFCLLPQYCLGIANIFLTVVQLLSPYHCLQGVPGYEVRMSVAIC